MADSGSGITLISSNPKRKIKADESFPAPTGMHAFIIVESVHCFRGVFPRDMVESAPHFVIEFLDTGLDRYIRDHSAPPGAGTSPSPIGMWRGRGLDDLL
jgi:hypothetical protein